MIQRIVAVMLCLAILLANGALAGGFAHDENFVVQTGSDTEGAADRAFAEAVLRRANEYRDQIAQEWLGRSLPPSIGRTHLTVRVDDSDDRGRMWSEDSLKNGYHNVHLCTSQENALGGTLAHEIAHVILAERFPGDKQLPVWAQEGIASRYDGPERQQIRNELLAWYHQTDNWPRPSVLLAMTVIQTRDRENYTLATSLVDFLLTKGDRAKLLEFASRGPREGWDNSLRTIYGIEGAQQLDADWQSWAKRQFAQEVAAAATEAEAEDTPRNQNAIGFHERRVSSKT